ncbi:hypothetical protein MJC1_04259 [Methylocystis sp. MJC1]|jgi:hypothetical protein|nr:hypothetical protein MJC1_04259 [Methylocystis sp. MJC1]
MMGVATGTVIMMDVATETAIIMDVAIAAMSALAIRPLKSRTSVSPGFGENGLR